MSAVLLGASLGIALGATYEFGLRAGASAAPPPSAALAVASPVADPGSAPALRPETLSNALPASLRAEPRAAAPVRDLDCLTQAVYFEARGESPAGQAAVAQVVLNRVSKAGFPKSVCGVVFQGSARGAGCQFSFACDGSMNRGRESQAWAQARHIASRALAGAVMTAVGDATHFHTVHVTPGWSREFRQVAQVGLHIFYRTGRSQAKTILAEAPSAPPAPDLRVAEARLVSGPPADAIEVVETAPAPLHAEPAPAEAAAAASPAD